MSAARITEQKLGKLGIKLKGSSPKAIVTPPHLFDLPGVWALVGRRGAGKSSAVASLLRDYHAEGFLDRLFVVSPTAKSTINKHLFTGLLQDEDCYEELDWTSVEKVLEKVEEEGLEWRLYEKRVEIYERLQKYMRSGTLDKVPPKLLLEADAAGLLEGEYLERPTHKYGHSPRLFLLLDDCQASRIFSPSNKNITNSAAIRNRHLGGGVGLTMVYAMQSYSAHSGLPRVVREQATLMALWRMASETRRLQLADELSNDLDEKSFLMAYDAATDNGDPYSFLVIDFNAPKERRFRKCFDTVLHVEPAPKGKKKAPAAHLPDTDIESDASTSAQ